MTTLVLFDIDGTLMLTDGAGKRALHRALLEVFGSTGPAAHRFDGKTDPQIVRELMRIEGHADAHIDAHMQELLDRYLAYLEGEMADPSHNPRLLPGVRELLDGLERRDDVMLGLLTGNLREGARIKLRMLGVDPERFVVGAYGSDHELRPELPAIARERATKLSGIAFNGRDVVVIGDTPADVTCGRAIGARAIGVATGAYSTDELASYGAFAVFRDLGDTDAVIAAIIAA
jgi:phosphoglycolate phosphatase-like HAD superfamily hydrolase